VQHLAPRLEAMGWAPDGTVEAVRVTGAPGFAWGVQWHPEYDWERDAFSRAIFEAFGAACTARANEAPARYPRLAAE
jgi:putative glutamine amidotransferase